MLIKIDYNLINKIIYLYECQIWLYYPIQEEQYHSRMLPDHIDDVQ